MITALEQQILRDVLGGTRAQGITDENRVEHDAAILDLIRRQMISYNPKRPAQKFSLTYFGRTALREAESRINGPGAST